MKPLATNKRVLTWLNVYPLEETASKREKFLYNALSVIILSLELATIVGSVLFILKYWSVNLEDAFFAFFQIDLMINFFYLTAVAYIQRQKISDLFKTLTEICNARNNRFLFKTN